MNDRVFVSNDPVNLIDPTGEFFYEIFGVAAVGSGMSLAYLGANAKWGAEINELIYEANNLLYDETLIWLTLVKNKDVSATLFSSVMPTIVRGLI
ncbi:MAG: hypothetical protein L3J49_06605 [Desulfobulbaceae bacterium]|nr:hypothetical protein [Desulfobulbaceae bacterium]